MTTQPTPASKRLVNPTIKNYLLCPLCKQGNTKTIDTRVSCNEAIRRRRHCVSCGHRWSTYEISEDVMREYNSLKDIVKKIQWSHSAVVHAIGAEVSSKSGLRP